MSRRARVTVAALFFVAAFLLAAVDVRVLTEGHTAAARTPLSAVPATTGAPTASACDAGCTPTTTGTPPARTPAPPASAPPHTTAPAPATTAAPRPRPASSSRTAAAPWRPRHILAGYWEDFVNNAVPLRLASIPSGYTLVDVAFAAPDAAHDGGVAFTLSPALSTALGGYPIARFTGDVATLHARGQRVLISVNNAGGAVSIDSPAAAAHFADSVSSLMSTYGFDGVDIDVENGLNVAYTAQALQRLAALRPGVLITLAPQTADMQSTSGAYFQLALSIKSILTVSFTQYYNSGTMLGCDGGVYAQSTEDFMTALACVQLRGGLAPSQVGLGLPASTSAAKHGYLAPAAVNGALDCLATGTGCGGFVPPTTWPSIGGVMAWSINWDASNGYAFLHTVAPYLASLP